MVKNQRNSLKYRENINEHESQQGIQYYRKTAQHMSNYKSRKHHERIQQEHEEAYILNN